MTFSFPSSGGLVFSWGVILFPLAGGGRSRRGRGRGWTNFRIIITIAIVIIVIVAIVGFQITGGGL